MRRTCDEIIVVVTKSPARAAIAHLVGQNPYLMDNVKGLASWAVLSESEAASAADELATEGILRKYGQGVSAVYRLTEDPEIRACIRGRIEEVCQAARRAGHGG